MRGLAKFGETQNTSKMTIVKINILREYDSSPFIVNWDVQVVDELLKRRKEIEWWFIEGGFDLYVKRIEKPFVWGGEPQLLMASHILKAKLKYLVSENFHDHNIRLHVREKKLLNIETYGKEYEQYEKSSIKVLFYGYGHYENIKLRLPVPLSPNDFMDDVSDESDEGDAHEDVVDLGDEYVGLYLFRVDVVVPVESIRAISTRFANTVYEFFLGKRVAYHIVANYFSSMDGLDTMLENGPWFM
nr:hypothetical protein [Tanacetum cinerariifolium]